MKTIIFLAGFCVPLKLAKSKYVWNEKMWSDYNCIFLSSKTPRSEKGVKKELQKLEKIVNSFDKPIIAGHSLGAWWAANLAIHSKADLQKIIFLTPLADLKQYPNIFSYSPKYDVFRFNVPKHKRGPHKNLVIYGNYDLITPSQHGLRLSHHFDGMSYYLDGGHLYQLNHHYAISYMKDWVEL